uniref:ATP-dependent Clp protease adapter protein ClpS n=1 Tax=Anthurium amnicola TaxID=1678845 RepID=A0A1D1Y6I4_9ARAE
MALSTGAASLLRLHLPSPAAGAPPHPLPTPAVPVLVRANPTARARPLSLDGTRAAGAATRLRAAGDWNLGSLRGGGSGLLERPNFDQSQFDPLPQVQEGGDIGKLSDKKGLGSGDSFRVLLIDDARHTERLVEKALPQVVPSITANDARNLFHESHQKGFAVVIVTVKEHAEFYAQMMVQSGLRSAIEPDSGTV